MRVEEGEPQEREAGSASRCLSGDRYRQRCARPSVMVAGRKLGNNRARTAFGNGSNSPVIGLLNAKRRQRLGSSEHGGFDFPLAKSLLNLLPHHPRQAAFLPLPLLLCLVLVARLLLTLETQSCLPPKALRKS